MFSDAMYHTDCNTWEEGREGGREGGRKGGRGGREEGREGREGGREGGGEGGREAMMCHLTIFHLPKCTEFVIHLLTEVHRIHNSLTDMIVPTFSLAMVLSSDHRRCPR